MTSRPILDSYANESVLFAAVLPELFKLWVLRYALNF